MARIALPGDNPVPPITPPPLLPSQVGRYGAGGGLAGRSLPAPDLSGIGNAFGTAWMTLTDPVDRDRAIAQAERAAPLLAPKIKAANLLLELTGVPQAQRVGAGLVSPADAMPPILPGQGLISAAGAAERGAARAANAIPGALEGTIGEAAPGAGAFASREARPIVAGRTVQQQIDALRAKGLSPEEARATFQVPPESTGIQTATTAQLDPGKTTRAIQTALGHPSGGGMPPILADYSTTGPFAPKDLTKHGGVIGAATRAVMAGDKEITDILGPDLTQQLAQGKIAQLARNAGATEDAIRSAFGIMEHAAASVAPDVKALIRQAVRTGAQLDPEAEQALFAAEHKAITQAGLPVTDDAVSTLTDRLVAEARRVNKAVSGQTATLDQATQEGGSLFKAAGSDIVPAAPPEVPPSSGGGVPPTPPTPPAPTVPPASPLNFGNAVNELINFPRSLRAALDISALLRQGLIPVVSAAISRDPARRLIARNAFVNAVRGYGDRYAGQVWEQAMKDPLFSKWKDAGGIEASIPARSLEHLQSAGLTKEEFFQSGLAERIPVIGGALTASERSYGLTLSALRFETWKAVYNAAKAGGRILTPAEQQALAKWENVASGRGSLGSLGTGGSKVLNGLLFAPRFAVSRVEAPILAARLLADPATREIGKVAAMDLAKTVTAGFAVMQLAEAAGAKVGWDPTSTDFGKIRVGDTSFDIWGGFEQPAVLVARIALDQYTGASGKGSSLSGAKGPQPTVTDLLARYGKSKLGPFPGMLLALAEGKDFVGRPFGPRGGMSIEDTAKQIASGTLIPLSWQDAIDGVASDLSKGTSAERGLPPGTVGAAAGVASGMGIGASTYERPIFRDGLGRQIGGLTADPGPTPVTQAWEAMNERVRASGGTPHALVAPDKNVGSGRDRITLDPAETDRLAVLVGQERDKALTQLVGSQMFQNSGPSQKEKQLLSTKADADRVGQEAFALEAAKAAADDTMRLRAIRIGLVATSSTPERMDFISQLSKSGVLTHEMEGAIDDLRTQSDPAKANYQPSVNELLTWSGNARQYAAAPAWRVGDPATWAAVAAQATRLRAVHADLQREASSRGLRIEQLPDYRQYVQDYAATTAGQYKIAAFISLQGDARREMLSPQRAQIRSLPMWGHFQKAVEARDPYAIR